MTTLEAPVAEVTVYRDRARITRRSSLHVGVGEQILTLDQLPSSIREDSVRASGRGAGLKILGVEVVKRFVTEPPETNLADLTNRLEALEDQDEALSDAENSEAARLDLLRSLRESSGHMLPRGLSYGKTSLESVEQFAEYLERETEKATTRKREISHERRALAREIEALRGNLTPHWNSIERNQINVSVEASEETDIELDVTYVVDGASWEPLYDIRLVENKVTLSYLANVRQNSGEDWPAVRLSLSTARPAVSATIPELDPWYIDIFRLPPPLPMQAYETMAMPMAAAAAPMPAMRKMADAPPAELAQAEVVSTGASVTYRVTRAVAVPSDGSPSKTLVTALDLDARLDYVTVPRIAEEAYLRARIKNTSALIFLPGTASIFHEADFVGSTSLEIVVPNEEFEVQLGVDDRVKVERELSARSTGKTFIGNTKRTLFGYKITLTNNLARPARVTVFDQIPVSRHEHIKTRLQEVSPDPTEQTDLGILKWELELAPQQKQEINFTFGVEHPRDMNVTGLNL